MPGELQGPNFRNTTTTTTKDDNQMNMYQVNTTDGSKSRVEAAYYVVEDGLVTFKDDKHKQAASFNATHLVGVIRCDGEPGKGAERPPLHELSARIEALSARTDALVAQLAAESRTARTPL